MPVTEGVARRQCIPILYTRGTHYEVGCDMGRTFGSMIRDFVDTFPLLNESYIPAYETPKGKKAYQDTLEEVKRNYPQYVRELEGISDGARVPFYKLFLLHMDAITTNVVNREEKREPIGCTTICVNQQDHQILGHTEDALSDILNNFYFVSAHIISDKPQGRWGVTEECFTSLCYAGHLPGYTMNYNHHGLIFSINTLSAYKLQAGKTPRHFLTRALLSAENFEQVYEILRDNGVGAGDGCSINMTFLEQEGDRLFHNIEMAPAGRDQQESQLNILTISPGENIFHCNKFLRLYVEESIGMMVKSSVSRMETLKSYPPPQSKQDVIQMLGDQSGEVYKIFQEFGSDDIVKTIAVGIFDCVQKTWSIYADNPRYNAPLAVLPLILKKQVDSK